MHAYPLLISAVRSTLAVTFGHSIPYLYSDSCHDTLGTLSSRLTLSFLREHLSHALLLWYSAILTSNEIGLRWLRLALRGKGERARDDMELFARRLMEHSPAKFHCPGPIDHRLIQRFTSRLEVLQKKRYDIATALLMSVFACSMRLLLLLLPRQRPISWLSTYLRTCVRLCSLPLTEWR